MVIERWIKKYSILRYLLVGGSAAAIHFGIYYAMISVGLNYNISYTAGVAVSLVFNFLASNLFTFNTRPTPKKGARFLIAHGLNYLLSIGLLNLYIFVGVSEYIAPILVVPISFPANYLMVRYSLTGKKGFTRSQEE